MDWRVDVITSCASKAAHEFDTVDACFLPPWLTTLETIVVLAVSGTLLPCVIVMILLEVAIISAIIVIVTI